MMILIIIVLGAFTLFSARGKVQQTQTTQTVPTTTSSQAGSAAEPASSLVHEIPLEVSFPLDGSTVATSPLLMKGKTLPNSAVFVNENEFKTDAQGNFSSAVELDEGENTIFVVANDDKGNYSEKDIDVVFEPQ